MNKLEGKREKKDIREFVDKYLLARDSKSLRQYVKKIQPDVDLTFFPDDGQERTSIPLGVEFFWPEL